MPSLDLRQLLLCLVVAHLFADFIFCRGRTTTERRRPLILVLHACIHAATAYVICGAWASWPIPATIFVSHVLIDGIKGRTGKAGLAAFLTDQAAHLAVIAGLAFWVEAQGVGAGWASRWGAPYLRTLLVAGGFVLATFAGGALIGTAVQPLLRQLGAARKPDPAAIEPESRGFENGGRIIGQLERGLIFVFTLAGQFTGIAFLIAAKSIFRFGELKDHQHRMEAEYILIGTLMSFGFGILASLLTVALLGLQW